MYAWYMNLKYKKGAGAYRYDLFECAIDASIKV